MSSQNVAVNDPISKAVMENIMGTLPTKKPLVKCNDCELCFTSQTVLEAHLQGSRHAKQVSNDIDNYLIIFYDYVLMGENFSFDF